MKNRQIMYKKIILSLVAIATISLSSLGQAPEGFKYQAVVRDAGNIILDNQAVGMRMTIQQGAIGGTTVYSETFSATTNAYGLVNLSIGNGTVTSGTFATIDWANGPYFMETAVDLTGGTSYAVMGTSQLMSVPYALYAKTSGSSTPGPQGIQGQVGNDGAQGATGPMGPQGSAGNDGLDGATGPMGQQGPQGNQGPVGNDGAQGLTGLTGATGPQGPQGNQGPAGNDGAQGPIGLTGLTGATGPQGLQGNQGTAGNNGAQGLTGLTGATGPQGPQGNQGPAGNNGAQGSIGLTGLTGATGSQGLQGPAGPAGVDGLDGADGAQGPAGVGIAQTLTQVGSTVTLSDGGGSINIDDADADATNEIQNIEQVLIVGNDANGNDIVNTGKIGIGTATPNAESSMEIATALPVIFPSMTQTQVNAITSPVEGMVQFNSDSHKLQVYAMLTDNAEILNEIYIGNESGPYNFMIDQSFVSPIDGQVIAIELMFKDWGPGYPGIDFMGQGNYTVPSYSQFTWHTFILTSPMPVTAGNLANFTFMGPGVDYRSFATNANYPNGSGCCFGNDDVLFRIHIQPVAGSFGWQNMH